MSWSNVLKAAGLLSLLVLSAACSDDKPVIRLHAWESDSHLLNNAIFAFVVENGYGYPVEEVVQTTPVLKETLPKGEVDLNLEGWQHNIPDWYTEHTGHGNLVNLGMNYEGGPQYYLIPEWVAEQYGIRSVFDLPDHWEVFRDPEDPSKGLFYNGVLGWESTKINLVKLEAYGLTRFYNPEVTGSAQALEGALDEAQKGTRPVIGYYWSPAPLNAAYNWHILEEPPYTEACWDKVTAATLDEGLRPIDEACAFPDSPIDKLAHKGFLSKAPDVVDMLRKMQVGLGPLNGTLAWAWENDVRDWKVGAVQYLRNNEERWRMWVTPDAYEDIKEALDSEGPT